MTESARTGLAYTKEYSWGIVGTGRTAHRFALDLQQLHCAKITAVSSSSRNRANAFAKAFSCTPFVGSRELAGSAADIAYIATPHENHFQDAKNCLLGGKHVLCEKPLCLHYDEAEELVELARDKKLFFMEGLWTRFFPTFKHIYNLINDGIIGIPRLIISDFCFKSDNPRVFSSTGGALHEVGVYGLHLGSLFFGGPDGVSVLGKMSNKIDESVITILNYPDNRWCAMAASIDTCSKKELCIFGSDGRIDVPCPWWKPSSFILSTPKNTETITDQPTGFGYIYEAIETMCCIDKKLVESPLLPHEQSLIVMKTVDKIKGLIGYGMQNAL